MCWGGIRQVRAAFDSGDSSLLLALGARGMAEIYPSGLLHRSVLIALASMEIGYW